MSSALRPRKLKTDWLAVLPFLAFCLAFEIVPILLLLRGSFSDKNGGLTLTNYSAVSAPLYLRSFLNSMQLSTVTAFLGCVLGLLVGPAIYRIRSPHVLHVPIALWNITGNLAGTPLELASIVIPGSSEIASSACSPFSS